VSTSSRSTRSSSWATGSARSTGTWASCASG
jgi:hypothetical protein